MFGLLRARITLLYHQPKSIFRNNKGHPFLPFHSSRVSGIFINPSERTSPLAKIFFLFIFHFSVGGKHARTYDACPRRPPRILGGCLQARIPVLDGDPALHLLTPSITLSPPRPSHLDRASRRPQHASNPSLTRSYFSIYSSHTVGYALKYS